MSRCLSLRSAPAFFSALSLPCVVFPLLAPTRSSRLSSYSTRALASPFFSTTLSAARPRPPHAAAAAAAALALSIVLISHALLLLLSLTALSISDLTFLFPLFSSVLFTYCSHFHPLIFDPRSSSSPFLSLSFSLHLPCHSLPPFHASASRSCRSLLSSLFFSCRCRSRARSRSFSSLVLISISRLCCSRHGSSLQHATRTRFSLLDNALWRSSSNGSIESFFPSFNVPVVTQQRHFRQLHVRV